MRTKSRKATTNSTNWFSFLKWKGIDNLDWDWDRKKKNNTNKRFPVTEFLTRYDDREAENVILGPGIGAGIGCGAGIGLGLVGGVGFGGSPWNSMNLVFGVGVGCGVGFGLGYGQGIGCGSDLASLRSHFSAN